MDKNTEHDLLCAGSDFEDGLTVTEVSTGASSTIQHIRELQAGHLYKTVLGNELVLIVDGEATVNGSKITFTPTNTPFSDIMSRFRSKYGSGDGEATGAADASSPKAATDASTSSGEFSDVLNRFKNLYGDSGDSGMSSGGSTKSAPGDVGSILSKLPALSSAMRGGSFDDDEGGSNAAAASKAASKGASKGSSNIKGLSAEAVESKRSPRSGRTPRSRGSLREKKKSSTPRQSLRGSRGSVAERGDKGSEDKLTVKDLKLGSGGGSVKKKKGLSRVRSASTLHEPPKSSRRKSISLENGIEDLPMRTQKTPRRGKSLSKSRSTSQLGSEKGSKREKLSGSTLKSKRSSIKLSAPVSAADKWQAFAIRSTQSTDE